MDPNNTNISPLIREREFADNAKITIREVNVIPTADYRIHDGINQSLIKKILEHGCNAGHKIYSEQDMTDDIILGRYYHSVCAGEELSDIYQLMPKLDRRTTEGKNLYKMFTLEAEAKGKLLIAEDIAAKANALAIDGFRLMRALNPAGGSKPIFELSLVATIDLEHGDTHIPNISIKGQLDYVEVLNSGKVFVGDYKTAPQCTFEAVKRKCRDSNWGLQAYVYSLLASAHFKMPVECSYVVSAKDTMNTRAFDISQQTLDYGKRDLIAGLYRIHTQRDLGLSDEKYLWRSSL